ncbi:MAG: hypothetical protein ABI743_12310 [bacterium]
MKLRLGTLVILSGVIAILEVGSGVLWSAPPVPAAVQSFTPEDGVVLLAILENLNTHLPGLTVPTGIPRCFRAFHVIADSGQAIRYEHNPLNMAPGFNDWVYSTGGEDGDKTLEINLHSPRALRHYTPQVWSLPDKRAVDVVTIVQWYLVRNEAAQLIPLQEIFAAYHLEPTGDPLSVDWTAYADAHPVLLCQGLYGQGDRMAVVEDPGGGYIVANLEQLGPPTVSWQAQPPRGIKRLGLIYGTVQHPH